MVGIYKITNTINGKFYIGLSNNIPRRFMEHKTPKNIKKMTTVLSKAFRKYGIQNFKFEIIDICNLFDLEGKEKFYISTLNPEYNMNEGGLGNLGREVSEHMRIKLSNAGKNQWAKKSKEEKEKIISQNLIGPRKGHTVSKNTRDKLRVKNLGKKQSVETIAKRAKVLKIKLKGNQNGNKKVLQICPKSGQVVAVFESIKIAANSVGIAPSGIISVCRNRQKTAKNYKWSYLKQ